MTDMQATSGI